MQPILQLCARNWKAEHMIQAHLQLLAAVNCSCINAASGIGSKLKSRSRGSIRKERGQGNKRASKGVDSDTELSYQDDDDAGLDNSVSKTGNGTQANSEFASNFQGTEQDGFQHLPLPPPTSLTGQTNQTKMQSKCPHSPLPTCVPDTTISKRVHSEAGSESIDEAFGRLRRQSPASGTTTTMIDVSKITVILSCESHIYLNQQGSLQSNNILLGCEPEGCIGP